MTLLNLCVLSMISWGSIGLEADPATDDRTLTAPTTQKELARLVRGLSDTSYQARIHATRRLCAIGRSAEQHLRKVAVADNMEAALRAKSILKTFDQLLFSGVEVTLSYSQDRFRWNEPVVLNITLHNPTLLPTKVPFDLNPSNQPSNIDRINQVTSMLDFAEWLRVTGPDGKAIDLVVDNIAADPGIHQAVLDFVQKAPTSQLTPGQSVTLTIQAFNRGWARYPLLDRGRYTTVFDYTPAWEDEALAKARAGRVVSQPASIVVVQSAPATVSRRGEDIQLLLERDEDFLVVGLTNRRDVEICVNKNFGPTTPFAKGEWVYELDGRTHQVPIGPTSGIALKDFNGGGLVKVGPGQRIELTRIELDTLLSALEDAGVEMDSDDWTIQYIYMNLTDRTWQQKNGKEILESPTTPEVLQKPLPLRLVTSRHSSNRLTSP